MGMIMQRNVSAAATGVGAGLLGALIPVVGLTVGGVIQLFERDLPTARRYESITEGVVDGSAALLAHAIFAGGVSAAGARVAPLNGDITDSDALLG